MFTVSTSKRPGTYHHDNLREALVQATRDLLEQGGESTVSLREAARRAGVSAMAPYRHFRDKSALLAAVAAAGFDELGEALRVADAAPSPAEALAAQGLAYIAFAGRQPALFRLMFSALRPERDPALLAAAERAAAVLQGRAQTIAGALAPADLALLAWSLVHGLAHLQIDGRLKAERGAAERVVSEFASMVTRN